MKKIIVIVIACILAIIGGLYTYNMMLMRHFDKFGKWERVQNGKGGRLPWIRFYWSSDSGSIHVPVRIENLPNEFSFQLDDGANLSMLYGNTLKAFCAHYPGLKKKSDTEITRQDTVPYLSDLHLQIDTIFYHSPAAIIMENFGDSLPPDSVLAPTIRPDMGTIGVDICKDKVLIIDYPHTRFCIVDAIPQEYQTTWADITLDPQGRPLLKMEYKGKDYKILFDCGSSRFPLFVRNKTIGEFSLGAITDTIKGSSWGKMEAYIGRAINDSFTLAGHRHGSVKVYANEDANNENLPYGCDGITGNILFFNNVLIIDFKNRKVGIL